MKIKQSFGYSCFTVFNTLFMLVLSFLMLYPMLYVVFASFSDSNAFLMHEGMLFWPVSPNLQSYIKVLENPMVWVGYKNILFILVVGTSLNMVMTILCAFVLSRRNLKGSGIMTGFIVFTMYFGGGLIPGYLNIRSLGLDNTLWALIIPGAMSAYNMIIMRTSFRGIPDSLEESATIDGASPLTILLRIIIPLSGATIAVIVLYYAVGHWNAWFNAMVYLRDRSKYPLQLVLREILIQNDTSAMMSTGQEMEVDQKSIAETIKYAVIVVSTIPILAVYPFLQKYFVKGVMIGAIKG
ncbi:MAG: carbohydrate ABC transporter permease [Ruminococcaceae bacterium]|nr:carbohydrate ABC transporter permease [Oscillospiraceae bacterium]